MEPQPFKADVNVVASEIFVMGKLLEKIGLIILVIVSVFPLPGSP